MNNTELKNVLLSCKTHEEFSIILSILQKAKIIELKDNFPLTHEKYYVYQKGGFTIAYSVSHDSYNDYKSYFQMRINSKEFKPRYFHKEMKKENKEKIIKFRFIKGDESK